MSLSLGIDIGTSGCRSCVIDTAAVIQAEVSTPMPRPTRLGPRVEQDPQLWWNALAENLDQLREQVPMAAITAIALDGTSGTLLCCDAAGNPVTPGLMYNDARATEEARHIARVAPRDCAAHGASSSLAKLLWLSGQTDLTKEASYALHQADWLLGRLCARFGVTDENNALKLGYDVINRRWPDWLAQLDIPASLFPEVGPAGQVIGHPAPAWCERWGFSPAAHILSGTTDSTASFIATGASPAEAVTALGSTLVLKIRSEVPVFLPENGIYSHRLGGNWLVGGASNTGGAVLEHFFNQDEIDRFTALIQIDQPTELDYYPLLSPGERFPVNDAALVPRLEPRPTDDAVFFQGILEGIADIEFRGYQKLAELGAPWPEKVITTGGGAANEPWRTIRSQLLDIPVVMADHQQASYGAALLALRATNRL